MTKNDFYLYFHSPCFDGLVSCVITWDFLETHYGYNLKSLFPVNYDLRGKWLKKTLKENSAVVDFLYHPEAKFWADHHMTTFLSAQAREDFEDRNSECIFYKRSSPSCALLLWEHLRKAFDYRNDEYSELVKWATKIDSAAYDNVEEAIFGDTPALRIRTGLTQKDGKKLSVKLAKLLRSNSLEEVANLPEIQDTCSEIKKLTNKGLKRFEKSSKLVDNKIVFFDVDSTDVLINRYAPYYFYPNARYSLGITHSSGKATITAMRNPWLDFQSVYLGKMFEKIGGGGHRRVASAVISEARISEIQIIAAKLLREVMRRDSTNGGLPRHDQKL